MSMEEKLNSQTSLDFKSSVLKPETEEQIADIIKRCYRKNIPLEIQGRNSKKILVEISKLKKYLIYQTTQELLNMSQRNFILK
jgi:hypothetical protein